MVWCFRCFCWFSFWVAQQQHKWPILGMCSLVYTSLIYYNVIFHIYIMGKRIEIKKKHSEETITRSHLQQYNIGLAFLYAIKTVPILSDRTKNRLAECVRSAMLCFWLGFRWTESNWLDLVWLAQQNCALTCVYVAHTQTHSVHISLMRVVELQLSCTVSRNNSQQQSHCSM